MDIIQELRHYKDVEKLKRKSNFGYEYAKSIKVLTITLVFSLLVFLLGGFLLDNLHSVRYLFYMILGSVFLSYTIRYYVSNERYRKRQGYKYSMLSAVGKDVIKLTNCLSLQSLVLIQLFYKPFFESIDVIFMIIVFISSLILLIMIEKYTSTINNLILAIFNTLLLYFVLITFDYDVVIVSLVVPVVLMFLLNIVREYLGNKFDIMSKDGIAIAHASISLILITISLLNGGRGFGWPDGGNNFFIHTTDNEEVFEFSDNQRYTTIFWSSGELFMKSNNKVSVYNSDFQLMSELDLNNDAILYQNNDDVYLVISSETEEDLEDNYMPCEVYKYNDGFEYVREVYQYTDNNNKPQEVFEYDGSLAYLLPSDYRIIDNNKIPYLQIYNESSNYGVDKRIAYDEIHYQDNDTIIMNEDRTVAASLYNGSRHLYSNGKFLSEARDYVTDEKYIEIYHVSDMIYDNMNSATVSIPIDSFNYNFSIDIQSFYYVDDMYIIYIENDLYIYNNEGELLNRHIDFPKEYTIDNGYIYYFVKEYNENGKISKLLLNDLGEYSNRNVQYLDTWLVESSTIQETSGDMIIVYPYEYSFVSLLGASFLIISRRDKYIK